MLGDADKECNLSNKIFLYQMIVCLASIETSLSSLSVSGSLSLKLPPKIRAIYKRVLKTKITYLKSVGSIDVAGSCLTNDLIIRSQIRVYSSKSVSDKRKYHLFLKRLSAKLDSANLIIGNEEFRELCSAFYDTIIQQSHIWQREINKSPTHSMYGITEWDPLDKELFDDVENYNSLEILVDMFKKMHNLQEYTDNDLVIWIRNKAQILEKLTVDD